MAPIGTLGGSALELAVTNSLNPRTFLPQKNRQEAVLDILVGLRHSFVTVDTAYPSLYLSWVPNHPEEVVGGEPNKLLPIQRAFLFKDPLSYKKRKNRITNPSLFPFPS
jgi:hypothetical protein